MNKARRARVVTHFSRITREQWLDAGLCWACGRRPRTAETFRCEECRDLHNAQERAARLKRTEGSAKRWRCGTCGELGHNTRTCPQN